jgi:hypothetical protein
VLRIRRIVPLALVIATMPVGTAVAAAATAKSGSPTSLGSLSTALQAEEKSTFKVVYVDHPPTGATSTLTFEQKPPNSLVDIAGGELLTTGGKSYYCSKANGKTTCLVSASNPFASLIDLFSPQTIVNELKSFQSEVAAKIAGVSVKSSSKTVAGKSAQCETVQASGQQSTWCVTGNGFLAYAGTGSSGYIQLQSYSGSASASDFKVPSGATITTIP